MAGIQALRQACIPKLKDMAVSQVLSFSSLMTAGW
jgi:hypothetical protein